MLWQECCPVISFWRREKMWALKMNVLALIKKKTHSFLYLKFTCYNLTNYSGREGDNHVEGSVNSWTLLAVSLFLEIRENVLADVTNCPRGGWEYKILDTPAQLSVGNALSAA